MRLWQFRKKKSDVTKELLKENDIAPRGNMEHCVSTRTGVEEEIKESMSLCRVNMPGYRFHVPFETIPPPYYSLPVLLSQASHPSVFPLSQKDIAMAAATLISLLLGTCKT